MNGTMKSFDCWLLLGDNTSLSHKNNMAAKSVLSIQIVPYIPILRVCEPIATTLRVVVLIGENGKIITDTGILRDIVFKWHNTSGFVKCAYAAILLNIKCQFDIIQTSRNIFFFNIYHGMPWCLSKLQTDWKGVSPFSPCLNVLKFNKFAILMPNMKSAITLMLSQLITT